MDSTLHKSYTSAHIFNLENEEREYITKSLSNFSLPPKKLENIFEELNKLENGIFTDDLSLMAYETSGSIEIDNLSIDSTNDEIESFNKNEELNNSSWKNELSNYKQNESQEIKEKSIYQSKINCDRNCLEFCIFLVCLALIVVFFFQYLCLVYAATNNTLR